MTQDEFAQELEAVLEKAFSDSTPLPAILFELQAMSFAIQKQINEIALGETNAETE